MKTEILTLLRETDGYVSGQELCEKFGVSRTAVWKAINQLKEAGYEIEAVQNKGYRLVSVPDILSESELQSVRKTRWIGEKIAFFDVVDSTNTRAKQLAEEGAPNGTYVIAERQDAGKGRRGRGFDSPAGQGIWMTLVYAVQLLGGAHFATSRSNGSGRNKYYFYAGLVQLGYLVHQSGHTGDVESAVTTCQNIAAYLDSNSIEINLHFLSFRIHGLLPWRLRSPSH